ncbi:magnesium transporter [Xanthomonas prunicola]|uniref:Magnesium transporter n=1 Tax=Xanthomonas prunicola TaxID=2053930 RepID=A0A2N3RP73_9XANT|nr:magnesium transporter [Xanthomonas prunicola]PKV18588.1 magnesium transporter [Xanthomonas prunicola]PKV22103.1 magnesium transporter [Xanthomonas prunicola]
MCSCIAPVIRNIDVRTSFARTGAITRNALSAPSSVRAVATARLPGHRCTPCVAMRFTLPLLYASKDSPAC